MFELKPLSKESIPAAFEKATRYRLIKEPLDAESICLDILRVEPDNQEAIVTLVLALTDQFHERLSAASREALEMVATLENEYSRAYYTGIIHERRGKTLLRRASPGSGSMAYDEIREAMSYFEAAEKKRPPGKDDAILRWNSCVRLLERFPELEPVNERRVPHMLE